MRVTLLFMIDASKAMFMSIIIRGTLLSILTSCIISIDSSRWMTRWLIEDILQETSLDSPEFVYSKTVFNIIIITTTIIVVVIAIVSHW